MGYYLRRATPIVIVYHPFRAVSVVERWFNPERMAYYSEGCSPSKKESEVIFVHYRFQMQNHKVVAYISDGKICGNSD